MKGWDEPQEEWQEKHKGRFFKSTFIFLVLVLVVAGGLVTFRTYKLEKEGKANELNTRLKEEARAKLTKMMADTYGGKTPQETLQMYISAIEQGDYELASKYFVEDERPARIAAFSGATKENVKRLVTYLKSDLKADGVYSDDESFFVIKFPVILEFTKYPNDIWKLTAMP